LSSILLFNSQDAFDEEKKMKLLSSAESLKGRNPETLVSEWNFEGPTLAGLSATDNDVKDTWGYNNGKVTGAPIVKDGESCISGKCLSFDGASSVSIPTNESFNVVSEITFEGWFYVNNYATSYNGPLLGQWTTVRFWQYASSGMARCFVWEIYNDGTRRFYDIDLSLIPLNQWTYLNLIYTTDGYLKIYQNGKLFGSKSVGVIDIPLSSSDFFLGNTYYNGYLDQIRYYKKALSIAEIKQNYIAGLDSLLSKNLISEEEYDNKMINLATNE